MKIAYKSLVLSLVTLMVFACQKSEETSKTESSQVQSENVTSPAENLEQEARIFVNEKGEEISIVYFANGEQVGVKLTINGQTRVLKANGTNRNGDPVFTDGEYAWEMLSDSMSGRLTDKSLNAVEYKIKE